MLPGRWAISARPAGCGSTGREAGYLAGKAVRDLADAHGFGYRILSPEEATALEPNLSPYFHSAIFWPEAMSASNPGAVTKAYAKGFAREGGRFVNGDGRSLARAGDAVAGRDGGRAGAGAGGGRRHGTVDGRCDAARSATASRSASSAAITSTTGRSAMRRWGGP